MKNAYLTFPYSHKSKLIRWYRWYQSARLSARIMAKYPDMVVFSPVTHSHPVSLFLGNGLSHDFWLKQDFAYLDNWADIMLIPTQIDATYKSKGILLEYRHFDGQVRPVWNDGDVRFDIRMDSFETNFKEET